MIRVENLKKYYPRVRAVDGLSLEVEDGEVLGLLGPNGAGKTTTLRSIAGILRPTEGRVTVAGFDVVSQPLEAKKQLAYVPDDPNLFDNLTVWEHIRLAARIYRVEDFENRGQAMLERFELSEKRSELVSELSRGMRQKLAAIWAFLHDPRAVLLDEPMTGLDPRGIRTMHQAIREQAERGSAIIISSHLLSMVERLCSKVLILHQGRSLLCETMARIRERFPQLTGDASLEEFFFHATEGPGDPPPGSSGPGPADSPPEGDDS